MHHACNLLARNGTRGISETPHAVTYAEQAQCDDSTILFTLPTAVACWVVFLLVDSVISQGSVFHSVVMAYLGSPLPWQGSWHLRFVILVYCTLIYAVPIIRM